MSSAATDHEGAVPPVVGRLERGETMPVCILLVGMAGSGKTSLLAQLQASLEEKASAAAAAASKTSDGDDDGDGEKGDEEEDEELPSPAYCVNLDPATLNVPYDVSIDIRDTVNYKQVMKQHKLGPNGAIMTSLNLFTTKFDQVMGILEQRAYPTSPPDAQPGMEYILVDTPGQIEAFTWSASGSIMSESLASAFPTVLCFVVDTARCAASPNTFMSNMLYACSMLYRTRLPLVVCFNKTDVVSHEFCLEWMRDYEAFQQALDDQAESGGFYGSLTRSMSLVLDEFYSNFANACGVSAVTGDGMDEFWATVQKAATQDFATDYVDDLKFRIEEQKVRRQAMARASVARMQRDLDAENEDEHDE